MAEGNTTNSNQAAKDIKAKTTTTKSQADTKAKVTATVAKENQSVALSVQPKTMLPQNRPIEPSHLEIVNTYSSVGSNRPVTKGTIDFSSSIVISGNRPIAASTLKITESYMGNRPVASNESDDTAVLMGYLD
ncbi:hypothetical protein I4641_15300 [Waterburya agarophytonicola K14]|uniref:Uncharacterized protein n=1 Tax=Waterburya agarophytonicola KI4 TaxID=2874699 RepID=A0A964FGT1_9CYAN|nr:hypothetical protein [Waterburya agarophytonicola]MCC0178347.1 hypothetical protein [Waterburya agarophytonicola KI4]